MEAYRVDSWRGHFRISHVGIVPVDAAGRLVFSGISRFPGPFIPALLHTHLASPSPALKTSMLTETKISSQDWQPVYYWLCGSRSVYTGFILEGKCKQIRLPVTVDLKTSHGIRTHQLALLTQRLGDANHTPTPARGQPTYKGEPPRMRVEPTGTSARLSFSGLNFWGEDVVVNVLASRSETLGAGSHLYLYLDIDIEGSEATSGGVGVSDLQPSAQWRVTSLAGGTNGHPDNLVSARLLLTNNPSQLVTVSAALPANSHRLELPYIALFVSTNTIPLARNKTLPGCHFQEPNSLSPVVIVPDNAADRRVFSESLHSGAAPYLAPPSLALKTSMLRAAHISSIIHSLTHHFLRVAIIGFLTFNLHAGLRSGKSIDTLRGVTGYGQLTCAVRSPRMQGREKTGEFRENPPTSGIGCTILTRRNAEMSPPGIEPGTPRWEASRLTTTSPQTLKISRLGYSGITRCCLQAEKGRGVVHMEYPRAGGRVVSPAGNILKPNLQIMNFNPFSDRITIAHRGKYFRKRRTNIFSPVVTTYFNFRVTLCKLYDIPDNPVPNANFTIFRTIQYPVQTLRYSGQSSTQCKHYDIPDNPVPCANFTIFRTIQYPVQTLRYSGQSSTLCKLYDIPDNPVPNANITIFRTIQYPVQTLRYSGQSSTLCKLYDIPDNPVPCANFTIFRTIQYPVQTLRYSGQSSTLCKLYDIPDNPVPNANITIFRTIQYPVQTLRYSGQSSTLCKLYDIPDNPVPCANFTIFRTIQYPMQTLRYSGQSSTQCKHYDIPDNPVPNANITIFRTIQYPMQTLRYSGQSSTLCKLYDIPDNPVPNANITIFRTIQYPMQTLRYSGQSRTQCKHYDIPDNSG
ncbi:hypothetical protein PR048_024214 [Dryococelus australis]|uniref:Uncharacterized protein n=1 Tax=Dryococelus australis TaxID=614101 RepID=A0ABQ9GN13_9NEOP|nr:hypothetical protein PR048_024214 [Dryococelus australis]